ncbi:Haloacid dehalogenase-like hydrolase domain-containing protein Sgpp [Camellia lanceoleosa]|uniref:Haloacid dehalogenase-like hydrolase domain-containing protein Sgpp n=1 Tax=Camellia lanceoleosa TaxID=1840588 RepID=A0ACC0FIV6_9ERIC|nr:Haloacid dehalogenase-like hydrolase domain-containing protein Sgpp [Camellia lanceoleosa]
MEAKPAFLIKNFEDPKLWAALEELDRKTGVTRKPSGPPPSRPPLFSLAGPSLFLLLQQIPRPPPSRQPLPHPPLSLQSSPPRNRSRRNPLCLFATDAWQDSDRMD